MNGRSNTPLIVGVVAVFLITVAAVVAVTIAAPNGANTGSLVTILLGSMAPTIATIVTLNKVSQTSEQVEELTNGLMDAKVRAGVHDVLRDDLVDPKAHAQLVRDHEAVDGRHTTRAQEAPDTRIP